MAIQEPPRAHHDPAVGPDIISVQNRSNSASWGKGLIQTLSDWFPELRRLQGRMERAQKLSYEEAEALGVEIGESEG